MYGAHRDLHVLTHSFPTRRSSDLRKRTPTGFLYPCPPAWPEFSGDGPWRHRGSVTLGYIGVWGDENNMDWRRFSNWDDGVYVGANLPFEKVAIGSYFDLDWNRVAQGKSVSERDDLVGRRHYNKQRQ